MSRTKRWELLRVVTRAPSRTLSNLEGAVAGADAGKTPGAEAGRQEEVGTPTPQPRTGRPEG